MRPPGVLLAIALATTAAGALLLASSIAHYLDGGLAPSSTSGIRVFRVAGELIAYKPYVVGPEPWVIGIGVLLLVAALLVKAALFQPSSATRSSIAGRKADAHTR